MKPRKVKRKSVDDGLRLVIRGLRSKVKERDTKISELERLCHRAENSKIAEVDELRLLRHERDSWKQKFDDADIERVKALRQVAVLEKKVEEAGDTAKLKVELAESMQVSARLLEESKALQARIAERDAEIDRQRKDSEHARGQ